MKKMNLINVLMIAALWSCNPTSDVVPPEESTSIVEWEWIQPVEGLREGLQISPILYHDWIMIFAEENNTDQPFISAYNKFTGKLEWTWEPNGKLGRRTINVKIENNIAILNNLDGIMAFNLDEQIIQWEYVFEEAEVWQYAFEILDSKVFLANKLKTNNTSIPFTDSVHLVAYDLYNGSREVIYGAKKDEKFQKTPQLHPPILFKDSLLIFQQGYLSPILGPREALPDLIALNYNTGDIIWQDTSFCEIAAGWNFPPLNYGENVITIGDWSLYSYKATTGELNWRTEFTELKPLSGFLFTGPYLHNGVVYTIDDGGVINAVEANNGTILWTATDKNYPTLGPAKAAQDNLLIEKDILFVSSWNSDMILFDIHTGKELERHDDEVYPGDDIIYDPETDLFFVTTMGNLKAFKVNR